MRELLDSFVVWCGNNDLILIENKTKGIIVDYRKTTDKPNTIPILEEEVELVEKHRNLGVWSLEKSCQHKRSAAKLEPYFKMLIKQLFH